MESTSVIDFLTAPVASDSEVITGLLNVLAASLDARMLQIVEPDGTRTSTWVADDCEG
ncbi:MAG: hypothetical protein JWN20_2308, partial [Jatrophihabitantaceae bacterium]|nr:hypothetical protein [Jatrophihabitantaceae bacterium]